jgi:hypothetical protein
MHPSSQLAFHAPFYDVEGMEDLPVNTQAAKLAENYADGVAAVQRLVVLALNDRFRFPTEQLQEMLKKKPKEFYVIDTVGKAIRYRINLFDAVVPATSASAFCNVCANYYYGARESYGTRGQYRLCIPAVANPSPQPFATGYRLLFEAAAPYAGDCVIDIETTAQAINSWFLIPEMATGFGRNASRLVKLSYWYRHASDTPLSAIVRR